jgi:hypothetical protein
MREPEGKVESVAMASEVGLMVRLNDWLAVAELASLTVMPNVEVPAAVGVPAITPPEERARPAGKAPDATDLV